MKPLSKHFTSPHQAVRVFVLIVSLGGIIWYGLFQARLFLGGPTITLINEPSPVQHDQTVLLEGIAENITALSLNGQQIFTDEHGVFTHVLVLEHGYTIMTLSAKDRYGHVVSLSRPFVYAPNDDVTIN